MLGLSRLKTVETLLWFVTATATKSLTAKTFFEEAKALMARICGLELLIVG